MNKILSFASVVLLAKTAQVTTNDCTVDGEGATFTSGCHDLYYKLCRNFLLEPNSACNVWTYDQIAIEWSTQDITAQAWSLQVGIASPSNPQCGQDNAMPTPYVSGTNMHTSGNICGYQIQLNNINQNAGFTVKVLTQSAITFTATAAVSVATLLALF